MKPQNSSNKDPPSSRQNPLKVSKESHKIIKNSPLQTRQSRAIYSEPQRVITATAPHDFTGNGQPTALSEVSPAARLASTEITTPNKKEKPSWSNEDDDMMQMLDNSVQMSHFPGILLPEPTTLPPTPSHAFSPITWPATPTDAFSQIFPPGTRMSETLQQKRVGMFSPILGRQSQTVLSYDVRPANSAFTQPSEFLSPKVSWSPSEFLSPKVSSSPSEFLSLEGDSPPSPPVQFNPFNHH